MRLESKLALNFLSFLAFSLLVKIYNELRVVEKVVEHFLKLVAVTYVLLCDLFGEHVELMRLLVNVPVVEPKHIDSQIEVV